jgi:hypothetical protein
MKWSEIHLTHVADILLCHSWKHSCRMLISCCATAENNIVPCWYLLCHSWTHYCPMLISCAHNWTQYYPMLIPCCAHSWTEYCPMLISCCAHSQTQYRPMLISCCAHSRTHYLLNFSCTSKVFLWLTFNTNNFFAVGLKANFSPTFSQPVCHYYLYVISAEHKETFCVFLILTGYLRDFSLIYLFK